MILVMTRQTSPFSSATKSFESFALTMRGICHTRSSRPAFASASSFSWQCLVISCMLDMIASGTGNTLRFTFCKMTCVSVKVLR